MSQTPSIKSDDDLWSYDSLFDNVETQLMSYPLPEHTDASLCRDEFLKSLFVAVERDVTQRRQVPKVEAIRYDSTTAEGIAIFDMLRKSQMAPPSESISHYRPSLTSEQLEKLYTVCLYQFQKAAIQFLSVRLRKQIDTQLHIWPGEAIEIPHHLFHWSLEFFLRRQRVNQLYLDVLIMDRSKADLNCAKFCTDLNEIIRLLELIREDFKNGRDICNTSSIINDSNYEVNSTWVKELNDLRRVYHNLDSIIRGSSFRTSPQCGLELEAEGDKTDALSLIEMRYRSNWLRSCSDQAQMLLQKKENVYADEIKQLQNKMVLDVATFGFVDFVYQYSIDSYRSSISEWQERLEVDLEAAELKCNITRSLWVKAKDDLKFHQEEVERFRRRVSEVRELIELEQAPILRRATRASSMGSRSRKSTLIENIKKKKKK
ncbi:uncharacterized protein LOC6577722 isoform X1 [Drosophila mojavensis]|uniref:Uncharacterized protein, isoform B n=1 Tax=Drosophila mojavensis TaxID=7230 RepID=B4KFJ9_DROMO|nr:uncharacterized protein LOC6577722 isoform X1 [Drosophila mojavensis]EDW13114.2 uncharacterized protein Dmoj_GI18040, isoform B [Drosophila mojavensis]